MALIREVDGNWQVEQPAPLGAPLAKGLKFVVNPETKPENIVTYELKDWYYRIDGRSGGALELVVQEIRPSLIDRQFAKVPEDWQFMVGGGFR